MGLGRAGQPPYGFRWKSDQLVSQESEAHVRREIFDLFRQHRTKGAVVRFLNEQGYKTRRGSKWSDVAVARQLVCSSAIGIYAINKTTTDSSGKRIERPKEEWDYVPCERIVSDEVWEEVQSILGAQKSGDLPIPRGNPAHTFTGILRCTCGGTMTVTSKTRSYSCSTCETKIPEGDMEEIWMSQFQALVSDRRDIFGEFPADHSIEELADQLDQAQSDLRLVKEEMSNLENLFAKREISLERFSEVHGPLDVKRESLNSKISRLRDLIKRRDAEEDHSEEKLDFQILAEEWSSLPLEDKRAIVTSLLDEVIIGDGEIQFRYSFPENLEEFSKDAPVTQQTGNPTNGDFREPGDPVYLRLPAPGTRCELTGLSRSKLNELILKNERNNFNPPVRSLSLIAKGQTRGTRLIVWSSLKQYLADKE